MVTMTLDGDVRNLTTCDWCPKCADKPGKKGVRYTEMGIVGSEETVLIVFDEYEIHGVLDFRDSTAIHRLGKR